LFLVVGIKTSPTASQNKMLLSQEHKKKISLNELEHNVLCPIEINEVSKTQLYRYLVKNRISYRESEIIFVV